MNKQKGIIYALIAGVFSGIAIVYAKFSVMKIDPIVLTSSRNIVAFIIIFILFLFQKKKYKKVNLSLTKIKKMMIVGVIGGSIPFILFFTGLKKIGAFEANIIQKSLFIWTALLSILFFRKTIHVQKLYALIWFLLLFGTYSVSGIQLSFNLGTILVLIATLFWSLESILVSRWRLIDSSLLSLSRLGFGLIILWLTILFTGKLSAVQLLTADEVRTIFIGGTILSGYVYCYYRALQYLAAHAVVSLLTISTLVNWLINVIYMRATIQISELISYTLILFSIGLIVLINVNARKVVCKKI